MAGRRSRRRGRESEASADPAASHRAARCVQTAKAGRTKRPGDVRARRRPVPSARGMRPGPTSLAANRARRTCRARASPPLRTRTPAPVNHETRLTSAAARVRPGLALGVPPSRPGASRHAARGRRRRCVAGRSARCYCCGTMNRTPMGGGGARRARGCRVGREAAGARSSG